MDDKTQNGATELKPGETIRPGGETGATTQATPAEPVLPPVQPVVSTAAASASVEPQEPVAESTSFTPPSPAPSADDPDAVSWTASEYIDHAKSFDWYLSLAVVAILSAAALYALFRDVITSATPVVAALALGFYARRPPRQLQYRVDSRGLTIAQKYFPYEVFRSFAVLDEGPFVSVVFLPLKRFGLMTTVYLDPKDEERVLDLISDYLPLEPRDHDMVDRFMKRIRF